MLAALAPLLLSALGSQGDPAPHVYDRELIARDGRLEWIECTAAPGEAAYFPGAVLRRYPHDPLASPRDLRRDLWSGGTLFGWGDLAYAETDGRWCVVGVTTPGGGLYLEAAIGREDGSEPVARYAIGRWPGPAPTGSFKGREVELGAFVQDPCAFAFRGGLYVAAEDGESGLVFVARLDPSRPPERVAFVARGAAPEVVVLADRVLLAVRRIDREPQVEGPDAWRAVPPPGDPIDLYASSDLSTWTLDPRSSSEVRTSRDFRMCAAGGALTIATPIARGPFGGEDVLRVHRMDLERGTWSAPSEAGAPVAFPPNARLWITPAPPGAPDPAATNVWLVRGAEPLRRLRF